MEINFQCPDCGAEIQIDTIEKICICPLCVAISGKCMCNECILKDECLKDCERWPVNGE